MNENTPALIRTETVLLALIVTLYLVVGTAFALRTPAWQAPDEPAHYNYVAQLAEGGCCPVIGEGDWDQEYLNELTSARFAPETLDRLDEVQYENHQPPVYYLLLTPIYQLTGGDLFALRLMSVAMGLLIVISAYGTGRIMFPERPQIALGATAFVAFLPQHIAIIASVNNDALGWALVALILWATVAYVKDRPMVKPWMLGLLVGIALITKATAYLMAGVVFVALLLRWWQSASDDHQRRITDLVRAMSLYLVPALALGLLWWLRNFSVYGFPDFMGLAAHDAVVVGQPRTEELIAEVGFSSYLSQLLDVTYSSFIGRFGWMALPLQGGNVGWVYPLFAGLFAVSGLGLIVGWLHGKWRETFTSNQRSTWLLLSLTIVLSVLAYIYYNTEFLQFQARYMFPMLVPLGILIALGLDNWRELIVGKIAILRFSVPVVLLGLAVLDMWLLWTVITPNLSV